MALPKVFDPIFNRFRGAVPLNLMRALAKRESDLNPSESKDPAWGLMQVVPQVRHSYNRRRGNSYSQHDLLDPTVNVQIASDLLNRIAKQYTALHTDRNMKESWSNPEFVKLVVAGWNSGYSEAGGVGKVAKFLEARRIPVTHDNVFKYSQDAGATKHLANSTKYHWQRGVSDLYFAEGGPGMGPVLLRVGIAVASSVVIYGIYKRYRRIR